MRVGLALGVVLSLAAGNARADGERGPMFGFTLVGASSSRMPDQDVALGGVGLDLAWWYGRVGIAAEGSRLWSLTGDGSRAYVADASLRLRLLDAMVPSLLDPRDVELGLELQGIAERRWWSGSDTMANPTSYGFGVALRLRGSGDAPNSTLLAESRVFLRVMASTWSDLDAVARTTQPTGGVMERPVTVVFGLGGSWGTGTRAYADKLRLRPLDVAPADVGFK